MLEHPEIGWAERTGYPSWNQPKSLICDDCGNEIEDGEVYEDRLHTTLCRDCLLRLHKKG